MVRLGHARQALYSRGIGFAPALLVVLAAGCKSGSWGAKPSWWGFGGTPTTSSLAAAPGFDQDIVKPSETAKPYPATSTPEGYALSPATATAATRQAGEGPPALVAPSTVTYGAAPPSAVAEQSSPAATAAPPTSIGPQVGPYAGIQPQSQVPPPPGTIDPAAAATAGLAAAPAFGDAQPPASQPPAARYADARSAESWAASPPPIAGPGGIPAASAAAGTGDARYGQATGSRFGAPVNFTPPPAGPQAAAPVEPTAAAPLTAPPAALPAALPAAVPPPAAADGQLPGGINPPKRRPDPGYRPGGTSSYRPSRSILAGDEPSGSGVMPASFEAPPPIGR